MLYLINPDARCKGSISLGNYCGQCTHCRDSISRMHSTLWSIAKQSTLISEDMYRIRELAAEGLGFTDVQQLNDILFSSK